MLDIDQPNHFCCKKKSQMTNMDYEPWFAKPTTNHKF